MKTTLDRSALLFLKTLYETKNLVNAANQLGIPPATASRMLGKLREVFNDELFTRCSGGLAATWRTTQAMPDVIRLLADYDHLLEPKLFDPKTLKREFKIAGVDHGVIFLAPAIAKISELAPGVSVDMTELTNDWPVQLRTGELDLLISPMETVPEGFPWLPLWEGRTTGIVVRPGHPLEALYEKTGRGRDPVRFCGGHLAAYHVLPAYSKPAFTAHEPEKHRHQNALLHGGGEDYFRKQSCDAALGLNGRLVYQFGRAAAHSGCF